MDDDRERSRGRVNRRGIIGDGMGGGILEVKSVGTLMIDGTQMIDGTIMIDVGTFFTNDRRRNLLH